MRGKGMTIPMGGRQPASGPESEPQGEDLIESSTPILAEPARGDRSADALTDSVRLWLREIGQFPRLSREQEQALAQRIEQGDHEAFEQFVTANLRLVVSIAKRYQGHRGGLTLLDLIQEGNLGLLEAVKRYDWRRQLHFSTVAYWRIRTSITRAIAEKARLIRMTADTQVVLRRIAAYQGLSAHDLDTDEAIEEVAKALGRSATAVRDLLAYALDEPLSLSFVVGEEQETELGDLLVDDSAEIPGVLSTAEELLQFLATVLSPRELLILTRRHGLDGGITQTLEAIGAHLQVSRERVRQVEEKALDKLRDPAVAERLREML